MDVAKVTGTLSYPKLPVVFRKKATIYITLVDVSPREDSGRIISRLIITNPSPSPIYFELKYNLSHSAQKHTYVVQAHVVEKRQSYLD